MEKSEKEALSAVSATLTDKPEVIRIDVKPRGWLHRFKLKYGLTPKYNIFEIKPQRVVNIHRIAGRVVKLDVGRFVETVDMYEKIKLFNEIMAFHADDIFYIVACAIQNNHKEPTESIINIVKNDFLIDDLYAIFTVTISNYDIASFSNSIALITGVDTLKPKASPMESGV